MSTPDVGDLFEHEGETLRVSGWLRVKAPPEVRAELRGLFAEVLEHLTFETARPQGPDRKPLEFCTRDDAEYVSGSGVAGRIVRVADVTVTGRVPWSQDVIDRERRTALAMVGQEVR